MDDTQCCFLTFYKLNTQYYPNSIRVIAFWDYFPLNLKVLKMHYWPPFPRKLVWLFLVHHFSCFGHQVIVFITIKVSTQTWSKMQEKDQFKKLTSYTLVIAEQLSICNIRFKVSLKNTTGFHVVCIINKCKFLTIKCHYLWNMCRLRLEMSLMTLQWFEEN